jgi:hypothetical protein
MRQRMLEEVGVVALAVAVQSLMRAARFPAVQRRAGHRLRHFEQEAELDRLQPVGIPHARFVIDRDVAITLAQLGDLVAGCLHFFLDAIDAAALLHADRHLLAQDRNALGAVHFSGFALDQRQRTLARGFGLRLDLRIDLRPVMRTMRGMLYVLRSLLAGDFSEHAQLRQRIRTEPVRAVNADTRAFANCIQAWQRRRRLAVDLDAAHRVVHGRAHRNRCKHRIDAHEALRHFAD